METFEKAPAHLTNEETHVWASGYEAAVRDAAAAVENDDRPAWHSKAVVGAAVRRAVERVKALADA